MYLLKTCKKNIIENNIILVNRLKKYSVYFFMSFISCTLTLHLTSCTSIQDKKFETKVTIAAGQQLNPDIDNANRPVNIKVFFLKSEITFNKGNFAELNQTPAIYFGDDLIHVETLQVLPGQKSTIRERTSKEAKFVAVVAAFRDLTDLDWKAISPIPERCWTCLKIASRDSLTIYLEGTKVSLSTEGVK